MSHRIHTPRTARALPAAIAALALAAASVLALALPAAAHDELVSSDPAEGAVLTAAPAAVTLVFSGELQTGEGATEVQVTDASGASVADGAPTVVDATVTQAVLPQAEGAVTVLWKVVSSDGHPISGELSFTVDAPAPTPTTPSPTAAQEPSPTATAAPVVTASVTPVPEDPNMTAVDLRPWFIGALVLVALVGGAVVYLLVSRARREKALQDVRGAGSDGTSDR